MRRMEIIIKETARARAYAWAFWIFGFTIFDATIAMPSPADMWPTLSKFTGNSWLAPWLAGTFLLIIWNQSRMPRCPRCRRLLNAQITIATDRCGRCGQIAVDDPRRVAAQEISR